MTKKNKPPEPHWRHWSLLYENEFAQESDRAAVILSASMLDQVLENILRSHLSATSSTDDDLFDHANAPLSTFSSRVNMCQRLGLISPKLCRDLHIIRRIRNQFAHNITGCTFESSGVRNRILELVRSTRFGKYIPASESRFPQGPKGEFQLSVSVILTYLWMQAEEITQLSTQSEEYIYDTQFWKRVFTAVDEKEAEPEDSGDKE